MENSSNPRTKKIQKNARLTAYLLGSCTDTSFAKLKNIFNQIPVIDICDSKTNAVFLASYLGNSIEITTNHSLIDLNPILLPDSIPLLKKFFEDYQRYLSNKLVSTALQTFNPVVTKNLKSLDHHIKKIESGILRSNNQQIESIKTKLTDKNEVKKFLSKCITIDDLPLHILKLHQFKNYKTCQILIHEKGNTAAESLFLSKSQTLITSKISVVQFNKIHTIIKKSKTKLFNQTQLLNNDLGVRGTFLAREINLFKHSIIIVVSRNDFFPATTLEQEFFQEIIKNITLVLNNLLMEYLSQKRNKLLKLGLLHLDIPLEICDSNRQIFFSNSMNTTLKYTHQDIIDDNYTLRYSPYSDVSYSSDLYHFQRISLLGELLNTLRHELNNPLFGLKLTADLLIEDSTSKDFKETLDDISSNCQRCQNIITNFSLLYNNQDTFIDLNLYKLLKETLILTKSETRGIEKEIIFSTTLPREDFKIKTNPTWLAQIIFNFIINSAQAIRLSTLDFTHQKITITATNKCLDTQSNLIISVTDTGPGIQKELIEKIFQPFITTKKEGTGLGLSICNYLTTKLGGKIFFSNNIPLPGATFSIELPLNDLNKIG